jgi:hypothetical protein
MRKANPASLGLALLFVLAAAPPVLADEVRFTLLHLNDVYEILPPSGETPD